MWVLHPNLIFYIVIITRCNAGFLIISVFQIQVGKKFDAHSASYSPYFTKTFYPKEKIIAHFNNHHNTSDHISMLLYSILELLREKGSESNDQ